MNEFGGNVAVVTGAAGGAGLWNVRMKDWDWDWDWDWD